MTETRAASPSDVARRQAEIDQWTAAEQAALAIDGATRSQEALEQLGPAWRTVGRGRAVPRRPAFAVDKACSGATE
ncbi:MAG: hypothetical protein R3C99_04950 [Pirellulaceae bacterium]